MGNLKYQAVSGFIEQPDNIEVLDKLVELGGKLSYSGATIASTDEIKRALLPLTAIQRDATTPGAADAYALRIWNTDTNRMEMWDGDIWIGAGDVKVHIAPTIQQWDLVKLSGGIVNGLPEVTNNIGNDRHKTFGFINSIGTTSMSVQRNGVTFARLGSRYTASVGYFIRPVVTEPGRIVTVSVSGSSSMGNALMAGTNNQLIKIAINPISELL